jgi:CRISPR-associated protein Cmr3
MTQTSVAGLRLEPLDTLFFRDGRPFEAASRVATGLPQPQTLAGALRTWYLGEAGCDFGILKAKVKEGQSFAEAARAACADGDLGEAVAGLQFAGPWFAESRKAEKTTPLVAVPTVLKRVEDTEDIVRLSPLANGQLPGWSPPRPGMVPLWIRDRRRTERLEGYLTLKGLAAFLRGGVPEAAEIKAPDDLFGIDLRTGIGVDPDKGTAADGLIYAVGMLAMARHIVLYAEVRGAKAIIDRLPLAPFPLPLGGEGRRVALTRLREPAVWPDVDVAKQAGTMILMTTPAPFAAGWAPEGLDILASAVSGHVAVSGWDMARNGPKPNRFAVSAGSVYFMSGSPELPELSLCTGEDSLLGWGTYVRGVWDHA